MHHKTSVSSIKSNHTVVAVGRHMLCSHATPVLAVPSTSAVDFPEMFNGVLRQAHRKGRRGRNGGVGGYGEGERRRRARTYSGARPCPAGHLRARHARDPPRGDCSNRFACVLRRTKNGNSTVDGFGCVVVAAAVCYVRCSHRFVVTDFRLALFFSRSRTHLPAFVLAIDLCAGSLEERFLGLFGEQSVGTGDSGSSAAQWLVVVYIRRGAA